MRVRLFAELCCGSAAVTVRLLGGSSARPPVSYMGSKRGYAGAILDVLGLRAGAGADACLLADPGPWSRVWSVLTLPDGCREVAGHLRGWVGEDPRALWDRLRADKPLEGATTDPRDVAAWLWVVGHGDFSKPPRLSRIYAAPAGDSEGRWKASPPGWLANRVKRAPRWPTTTIATDARVIPLPERLPDGCYVYIDPPYRATTGYAHDLPRADVLDLALRWSDAGAVVAVSEAEPLPLPGWHHVELTGERVGQKRTFSRQQAEWLTLNRAPAVKLGGQGSLFR